MDLDFQAIMLVATVITGAIWAVDAWVFAPRRRAALAQGGAAAGLTGGAKAAEKAAKEPAIVEYSRSFFPIILIVLLLRSFLVEPFRIPSGSMMPTLLIGDFILVNKFAYGIRLPVLNKKVIDIDEPERGDVVVFRYPEDTSIDYIKRIVGLPGDRIGYYDKVVYINGEAVAQELMGSFTGVGSGISMSGAAIRQEHLGNIDHAILVMSGMPSGNGEIHVPEGHYFVMGDNRDNSKDSRFWGFLPEDHLKGKAFMIWMNWDSANGGVAWDRIGTTIK